MEPHRASSFFLRCHETGLGEPLDSYQKILNSTRTTKTQTGLTITAYLDRRNYPCGLKPTSDQLASRRLRRHETLPEWNYTIKPQL